MRGVVLAALTVVCVASHAPIYDLSHLTHEMRSFINQTTHLRSIVELASTDPERLALMLQQAPFAAVAQNVSVPPYRPSTAANPLPLVVAHGMGDSCFNPGMKSVTQASGNRLGVYATCIPTADHWITDTIDGFLKSMDKSVDTVSTKLAVQTVVS